MPDNNHDLVHFNAIRKALANGNAAVMVGAGFSRNAENGHQLAMWYDIAKELWRELNPYGEELKDSSSSTVVQLGEQYARVFSKPALEELLGRMIPDSRVKPGPLHNLLLQLPWSEIFTTNYDTLLERAAEDIVDVAHYTVMCREDIPQSKILDRRRIVKLHGSFPSQRPFIFTEEDYRTYPEKFAPFVNLVRQSLLENTLCLIGFSGDDPNFLHWIGWVRDMLDKHALPIYLFLSEPPSLGQKALLESRQVTPVVLPLPNSIEKTDYYKRYESLLKLLAKPLHTNDLDWGRLPTIPQEMFAITPDVHLRRHNLFKIYEAVSEIHSTYPEWIVAPEIVRNRLRNGVDSISGYLHGDDLIKNMLESHQLSSIAVLSKYAWHQEVLLQCLDDSLAAAALALLRETSNCTSEGISAQKLQLAPFRINSLSDFFSQWRDLGISVLRWARQELRKADFEELRTLLLVTLPKDTQLKDEVAHESILFTLYMGDRDVAQRLLSEWSIQSSDRYMLVRKGMLLAEVGEPKAGLAISLNGLQQLRSSQRFSSKVTQFLSQEAWACLAIRFIQQANSWNAPYGANEDEAEKAVAEELTRRLSDLAAKGYDSQGSLKEIISELNAEAPPPFESVSYTPKFEPGRFITTHHLGGSSELRNKIQAAFAWLSLIDRVALPPRIQNSTFHIDSLAQAAWWAQYSDSHQRVLSVMARAMTKNMLKPREPSQLPHKRGWLSRYQVARTDEPLAIEFCTRAIDLVERVLNKSISSDELERVASFNLEIFSRLIIRITNSQLSFSFAERIIALHHLPTVWRLSGLWEDLSLALERCYEALGTYDRSKLILPIINIPAAPQDARRYVVYKNKWVCFNNLYNRKIDTDTARSEELARLINNLVHSLSESDAGSHVRSFEPSAIWEKLFWLNSLALISPEQQSQISSIILQKESWPYIPDHHPWAIFSWAEAGNNNIHQKFRAWLLSLSLKNFSELSNGQIKFSGSDKSWSLNADNEFLECWIHSIKREQWHQDDISKALEIFRAWWDGEWEDLAFELSRLDELLSGVKYRLNLFDTILSELYLSESGASILDTASTKEWLYVIIRKSQDLGIGFWKFRLSKALKCNNLGEIKDIESELAIKLLGTSIPSLSEVAGAISFWINHSQPTDEARPSLLIETLSGLIASRRMPALPWSLSLTTQIAKNCPHWLTENSVLLIHTALKLLHAELAYFGRPSGTGIPDDYIPSLRLNCSCLAIELIKRQAVIPDSLTSWIDNIPVDPLPEVRFLVT